jgi:hypothetical protein
MAVVLVLNNLGGMIGLRGVRISLIDPAIKRAPPTTMSAMVFAEFQLDSPELNPTSRRTTPDMIRKRPKKSNSAT